MFKQILTSLRNSLDKFRVTPVDKLMMAKHLSTLIKAGIPIDESLEILAEEALSKRLKKVVMQVRKRIDKGEPLAASMEAHPAVFSMLFVQMVRVGEESGTLEENLRYIAEQMEHEHNLRQKIKSAASYPILVLVLAFFLSAAMSFFVLPRLIPLFTSLGVDLPLPTKIVLFASKFLTQYGAIFFSSIIAGFFALRFFLRTKTVRPLWHRVLMRLPLIAKVMRNVNMARINRTLGILLKSGLPIIDALIITTDSTPNHVYRRVLIDTQREVERGLPFSEAMRNAVKNPHIVPKIIPRMIGVGERTGTMDESMIALAEFYEREVDTVSKTLSTILEPALLIFIGLIVGLVAIAIISPIYRLTGSLNPPGAGG